MNTQLWWLLARATGFVAWGLLTASVIWGLLLSTRLTRGRPTPAWLTDLHRFLGGAAVVFTALHLGSLVADSYTHFGLAELLIPLAVRVEAGTGRGGRHRAVSPTHGRSHLPAHATHAATLVEGDPSLQLRALLDRDAAPRDGRHGRRQPRRGHHGRRRCRHSRVPHPRENAQPPSDPPRASHDGDAARRRASACGVTHRTR